MNKIRLKAFAIIFSIGLLPVSFRILSAASSAPLIDVRRIDPTLLTHLAYATDNNFLGSKLYDKNICMLREPVARDLAAANREFMSMGYRIKLRDCYRPASVSQRMWRLGERHNAACRSLGAQCRPAGCHGPECLWTPLGHYVAKNHSLHNRGTAVDLSLMQFLYDVDMGTEYDHFGPAARTNSATGTALRNRMVLKNVMGKHGFINYAAEWWHYAHRTSSQYDAEDTPL